MSEILKFSTAVVYADDVPATVEFYCRVTGASRFQTAVRDDQSLDFR